MCVETAARDPTISAVRLCAVPELHVAGLKRVFPRETWIKLHLQIIYFGREHCPARGHDLSACPICSWAATAKRIVEEARR